MGSRRLFASIVLGLTGAAAVALISGFPGEHDRRGSRVVDAATAIERYGQIPLGFEPNRGQGSPEVEFLSRGPGYGLYLSREEVVFALGRPGSGSEDASSAVVRMGLIGAEPRRPRASGELGGSVNYLTGSQPRRWRTGVPTFRNVSYDDVYPGIDFVVRGNPGVLEYDFVLEPGADPTSIGLSLEGAGDASVHPNGDLVIETPAGELRQHEPYVYQRVDGVAREVVGGFTLAGDRVGFDIGRYDKGLPLVIDPVIDYSTFLGGGTGYDAASGLAVDGEGSAYLSGVTFAADFPTTAAAADSEGPGLQGCAPGQDPGSQPPPESTCRSDAFVTKLSPDGTEVAYSTYIGGDGSDRIQDIDVDRDGFAYVTGGTDSTDFPTTPGASDTTAGGSRRVMGAGLVVLGEAFVAKLTQDGSSLSYSTLLGGGDSDEGMGVRIDRRSGRAYVAGHTFSADYPISRGAYDSTLNTAGLPANVCGDIFVTALTPTGRRVRYSTFIGGSRLEFGWDLDLDRAGSVYVMGETMSSDAPTTPGALQRRGHAAGGPETADCESPIAQFDDADPLVLALSPDGGSLEFSTYFGGSRHEHGTAIAVRRGAVFVVGHTNSPDFPTTARAIDRTPGVSETLFDGFAAKLVDDGRRLGYSTLLGGGGDDWVFDVDVDRGGEAYLTGMTTSPDFPTTPGAHDRTYEGPGGQFYDAFLAQLRADGRDLRYSTYFGGAGPDVSLSVVASPAGTAHIAGLSYSPDLETGPAAFDPLFSGPAGFSDAFVTKFSGFGPG